MLAFELTKTIHGEEEALKAQAAARALFSSGSNLEAAPTTEISGAEMQQGINILDLLMKTGLTTSRGEEGDLYSRAACTSARSALTIPTL